jgi:signal transduction histidine kinase
MCSHAGVVLESVHAAFPIGAPFFNRDELVQPHRREFSVQTLRGMNNCHDARQSPSSPKIERQPLPAKTVFDGTKLPLVPSRSKTTADGMKRSFSCFRFSQDRASPLTFDTRGAYSKVSLHINRSLGNCMRVASARAPLGQRCPSVILKPEEILSDSHRHHDRLAIVAPRLPSQQSSSGDRIAAIAELGLATIAAERCAVAFQSSAVSAGQIVCAPRGGSRWDAMVNAVLLALDNRLSDTVAARGTKRVRDVPDSIESIDQIALSAREIAAIARVEKVDEGFQIAGSAFSDGVCAVRIAIVARVECARNELEALLQLMARAAFGEIALGAAHASLDFWRAHGAESGRQAVGAKRELAQERMATDYLDNAVAAVRRAQPSERFGRFGEIVANGAGFDQWMVAVADSGELMLAASSPGVPREFDPAEASALSESFRRHIVIGHWSDRDACEDDRVKQYLEERVFAGSYVCIPFGAGAIALASRDARASAARAEAIVERLAPFAASWVLERDASRRGGLVRQLALRMFAAIDEERARIARDLHDDQAQLLAAAKIALEGPPGAARSIFKQVEEELRRKTRELRPTSIGNASLDEAIEREFGRLDRAGVKAKFVHLGNGGAAEEISRPVQQLCFQVVREALSNVIRHARAKSVQVTIESSHAAARVSVSDDGRGIGNQSEGTGLTGVRERLELMGGTLIVESRAGRTTVVAEIPESA